MSLYRRFRNVNLAPVVACVLVATSAVAASPAATNGAGNARTASMRARLVSSTALTVASGNGNAVTLVATVSGRGAAPAGTVVFSLQGKSIGEVPVATNGSASMTVNTLPTGLSSLSASFQGDGNLLPSTSATVRFYQDDQN